MCDRVRHPACIDEDGCDLDRAEALRAGSVIHQLDWADVRAQRDRLVSASDWTELASAQARLGPELTEAWMAYRKALFDLPSSFATPGDVVFPVKPGESPPDASD